MNSTLKIIHTSDWHLGQKNFSRLLAKINCTTTGCSDDVRFDFLCGNTKKRIQLQIKVEPKGDGTSGLDLI